MDDAVVEDEFEDSQNVEEIRNKNPFMLTSAVSSIGNFFQIYGWYLLITAAILYYLYIKYKTKLKRLLERKKSDLVMHRYDNEEVQKKHEGMEEARRRLQERYSMDAMKHREEEEAKEEEKRRNRIADWERHREGRGYRSKTKFRDASSSEPSSGLASSSLANQSKKKVYRTDGSRNESTYIIEQDLRFGYKKNTILSLERPEGVRTDLLQDVEEGEVKLQEMMRDRCLGSLPASNVLSACCCSKWSQ